MSEGKKSVRDFCDNPRSNPRSVRWSIPQPEVKRLGDANYEMVVVAKNLADLMPKTPDQNLRGELQAQINRLLGRHSGWRPLTGSHWQHQQLETGGLLCHIISIFPYYAY